MGKEYRMVIPAHPNIYQNGQREMELYFTEPSTGVNESTGLLLLIPNFGDDPKSDMNKQRRNAIADEFNLVTIECNYFGLRYMQTSDIPEFNFDLDKLAGVLTPEELQILKNDPNKFFEICSNYSINIEMKHKLSETTEEFNDLGLMQTLDNLTALLVVISILKDNNLVFNTKRILSYGVSHGAYLAYFCNAFTPGLFSAMFDNSAWLIPPYISNPKFLSWQMGEMKFTLYIDYLVRSILMDKRILDLKEIYRGMKNKTRIFSLQGSNDQMIDLEMKSKFCSSIAKCKYEIINLNDMKKHSFVSLEHGLGADFPQVYRYWHEKIGSSFDENVRNFDFGIQSFSTGEYRYTIKFINSLPVLSWAKNFVHHPDRAHLQ